jgi:general secretion pathway protein I
MCGKPEANGEAGFTLIELLVALAIFSLAALALLRLQGGTLRSTAALQTGIVAGIVARNVVVEAVTDAAAPALGRFSGQELNAGRTWRWTRIIGRTGQPGLDQVTVIVSDEAGRQAATLTAFRSAK